MPKLPLVLALMSVVAVIIVAMAVYVFVNFSSLDFTGSLIMIGIGLAGMLIILGVLIYLYRSAKNQK